MVRIYYGYKRKAKAREKVNNAGGCSQAANLGELVVGERFAVGRTMTVLSGRGEQIHCPANKIFGFTATTVSSGASRGHGQGVLNPNRKSTH